MTTTASTAVTCREFRPDDFVGVQKLWRRDAGWGELTAEMFREWYINIPDGPAILVIAEGCDGEIVGLITMTPHRVLLPHGVVAGARIAANVVAGEYQANVFDFATHPLTAMLLECRVAARRRSLAVLFGLPKVNWMNLLRLAAAKGVALVPHARIGCLERSVESAESARSDLTAVPVAELSSSHADLWLRAYSALGIRCAVHRDIETLRFRNGGHRNFEFRTGLDQLVGYASVRTDGLLFDIVCSEQELYDPAIAALLVALRGAGLEMLKVMDRSYFTELAALGFTKSQYQFGFVCDPLESDWAELMSPGNWYLAGGG